MKIHTLKLWNRIVAVRIAYSLLVIVTCILAFTDGTNPIAIIEWLVLFLVVIPYLDVFLLRIKIGREIEQYGFAKGKNMLMKFQPKSLSSLSKRQKEELFDRSDSIRSLQLSWRASRILLLINILFLCSVIFIEC